MRSTRWKIALTCAAVIALVATGVSAAQAQATNTITGTSYPTIQAAINAAIAGDTIRLKKGEYVENIVIDRSVTLVGEKREKTVIRPALSAPNPCEGSSLCGGLASNIILVQANNVTIKNLTLDGDNPSLHSEFDRGGANLDARNGIITNNSSGVFNDVKVIGVTVRNIYLRGIYAYGGTFEFRNNEVSNVQGDGYSIAIFNFGGAGVIADNSVSKANDGIASNWSAGVKYLNNEVRKSGSGIHTDNAGGLDLIKGNTVSDSTPNGYGIWVFVPYSPVSIVDNEIDDVDVGLALFGQGAPQGTATFTGNRVRGRNAPEGAGVFVTNDMLGYGNQDVAAKFEGNVISHNVDGFVIDAQSIRTISLDATCNSIRGNSRSGVTFTNGDVFAAAPGGGALSVSFSKNDFKNKTVGMKNLNLGASSGVDASKNWWGCTSGPGAHGCDTVTGPGSVTYMPWLTTPSSCAPHGEGDDDDDDKGQDKDDKKDDKKKK